MSDRVYQELLVRAAGDTGFAAWARGNVVGLREHYELTEEEARALASLDAEVDSPARAAASAGATALATRNSRSGILAIGGLVAAVAGGGAVYALNQHHGAAPTAANGGHPTLGIVAVEATTAAGGGAAQCGGNRLAIAGGYAVLGSDGTPFAGIAAHVSTSHSTGSAWDVQLEGVPAGATVQVRAICATASHVGAISGNFDGVQGVQLVEAAGPAAGGSVATTACPGGGQSGRVPLGGGFTAAAARVSRLAPQRDGYELAEGATPAALGQAVCAYGSADIASALNLGSLGWQLVTGPSMELSSSTPVVAEAACPDGWHLAGGGYDSPDGTAISGNLPAGNSWRAHGKGAGSLTAYAVCVV